MSYKNDVKVALNSCESHAFSRSQNQEPRSRTRWDVTFVSGCLLWVTRGGSGLAIASMFTSIETPWLLFGLLLWQQAISLGTWTSTLLWILLELCCSVWHFLCGCPEESSRGQNYYSRSSLQHHSRSLQTPDSVPNLNHPRPKPWCMSAPNWLNIQDSSFIYIMMNKSLSLSLSHTNTHTSYRPNRSLASQQWTSR